MKKLFDAEVIYCNQKRQPEPLLNEPEACESVDEFMDFLYTLIESVVADPKADDVLHAITTHAWTSDEFVEDDQTYVSVKIYVVTEEEP